METSVEEKQCPGCTKTKPFSEFATTKTGKLQSWCRRCTRDASNAWHKRHPEKRRNQNYKHNHKITLEEYNAMFAKQGGLCASCGCPAAGMHYGKPRNLAVDHCHKTGEIRGLLCDMCNRALGMLDDDPEKIKALLRYITENQK